MLAGGFEDEADLLSEAGRVLRGGAEHGTSRQTYDPERNRKTIL